MRPTATFSIFLFFLITCCLSAFSQAEELVYPRENTSYIQPPTYSIEDGKRYNPADFCGHPDFGKLTFSAPSGKQVVEDISKRTADERYYIDLNEPTFFYIEKSSEPINFLKDGFWRAIDPSLYQHGNGVWKSGEQPVQTHLDVNAGFTEFNYLDRSIHNNDLQLKIVHFDNTEELLDADWSLTTVTNFVVYVSDIFPGIDAELRFDQGEIKSNFIIKYDLVVKELVFIDNFQLSQNLAMYIDQDDQIGQYYVEIYNIETGETEFLGRPARSYDNSASHDSWLSTYELHGTDLHIICDSAHLNNTNAVYPITIDPTFTAVGPVNSVANVIGSLLSPASCNSNLNVTFPAGSTPWDTQIAWSVYSDFCAQLYIDFGAIVDCWRSEAQIWITSSCGGPSPVGAPGTIWTCPGCNSFGTWNPTVPFNSSGTQSLVQCYTPSCASQTLTFTINFNRSFCPTAYGYDNCVWANSYCQSLDQWSVTVQGRSVETLGNTATGNGSQNIYDADCAGTQNLNPTPLYGVPNYTYNWSNGATSPTITVPGTVSTYTCTVTDACGTSVVATFDIGCPLATNVTDFTAQKFSEQVLLKWEVENELEIQKYLVQRSDNGQQWQTLGQVNVEGFSNGTYSFMDSRPLNGLNYYRLTEFREDGSEEKTQIVEIDFKHAFVVYPNPTSAEINVVLEETLVANTHLLIYDLLGQEIKRIVLVETVQLIDLSEFTAGNYVLKLEVNGEIKETKRLTIK